jgi:hypothetical protein
VTLYAEQLTRVSLPQLRAAMTPRVYRACTKLVLETQGFRYELQLKQFPEPSVHGGQRRWLLCPCGSKTTTLALQQGAVGCRRCMRWRSWSRKPPVTFESPLAVLSSPNLEEAPR